MMLVPVMNRTLPYQNMNVTKKNLKTRIGMEDDTLCLAIIYNHMFSFQSRFPISKF